MKKYIIYGVAVLASFVITSSIGFFSRVYSYVVLDPKIVLCNGVRNPYSTAFQTLKIGFPLQNTSTEKVEIDYCGPGVLDIQSMSKTVVIDDEDKASATIDYTKNWQFYANWVIWSLPFVGMAYLIKKRTS